MNIKKKCSVPAGAMAGQKYMCEDLQVCLHLTVFIHLSNPCNYYY